MSQQKVPVSPLSGEEVERERKRNELVIQERMQTVALAIFSSAASKMLSSGQVIPTDEGFESLAEHSLDASCALAKVMWGMNAVRVSKVPPIKDASEPF